MKDYRYPTELGILFLTLILLVVALVLVSGGDDLRRAGSDPCVGRSRRLL